jgi:hypothetical protein
MPSRFIFTLSARIRPWLEDTSRVCYTHRKLANLPDVDNRYSQIASQIRVINAAYSNSSTGISWVLAGITRTINDDWFQNAGPGTSQQTVMKARLRRGSAKDLNVYTVGFVAILKKI